MAATIFALIDLCLVFIVYGIPIDETIILSPPITDKTEPAYKGIDPQTLGGHFEGDMIFPDGFDPTDSTRGVATFGDKKWPKGIVPYDISAITNDTDRKTITDAMKKLSYAVGTPIANSTSRKACVSFRPSQSTDKAFFKIQYGDQCSATVGHYADRQTNMTLKQKSCFYSRTIQHELMHILGFYHEQSRPDRDTFLIVNLENVEESRRHNFKKYAWGTTVLDQGSTYDYASIMHYGTTAFSMNGEPTMVPRQAGVVIGTSEVLSAMDISEVRHYYNCTS